MPRKSAPRHPFGKRLYALRMEKGLTQTQLAELIGASQRSISGYETVPLLPPSAVIIKLAKALGVSADQLLGIKPPRKMDAQALPVDPDTRRLWKKFQRVRELPIKDQRAVIRLINSLVAAKAS